MRVDLLEVLLNAFFDTSFGLTISYIIWYTVIALLFLCLLWDFNCQKGKKKKK